jgi:HSP20 family protein
MAEDTKKQELDKREAETSLTEHTRPSVYYTPAVDIYETEDALVLEAEVPGVSREGLDVRYEEGVLTIVGRTSDESGEPGKAILTEYPRGDYYRAFSVEDIDPEKIEAELSGGVLVCTLPKFEHAKKRKIDVKAK